MVDRTDGSRFFRLLDDCWSQLELCWLGSSTNCISTRGNRSITLKIVDSSTRGKFLG